MVLKRKRSASELNSSPLSTTSTTSTVSTSPVPFPLMVNAPHLPSRTLKRSRHRASDDEVHRRTLGLLYSAQRQGSVDAALPPGDVSDAMDVSGGQRGGAQRSLHSFWMIRSAPRNAPPAHVGGEVATACDDCGVDLPGEDAMDVDSALGPMCGPCGRGVCGHCSVTDVEGQRRCLRCAGRKV